MPWPSTHRSSRPNSSRTHLNVVVSVCVCGVLWYDWSCGLRFEGEYFPLPGSESFPMKPTGMSSEDAKAARCMISFKYAKYTGPSNSETKSVLPPLIFWAPIFFFGGALWSILIFAIWTWAIPSFLPSLQFQYDWIPFTRLGVAATLLGLPLAYCTSSISDGFCVEQGLQYGARRWSDVCRHHLLVSDVRGFMFCFACIACLTCSLHFKPQRPDYNRKEALQAGFYLKEGLWGEQLLLGGANVRHENKSTLVKILEVTSHSKGQPCSGEWSFCLFSFLDWFCDVIGYVPRLWTYSGSWKLFSHSGHFVLFFSCLERRLWKLKAFHSQSENLIAVLRISGSSVGNQEHFALTMGFL